VISPFKIFPNVRSSVVGRSSVGRSSIVNIIKNNILLLTLISYTPLRYVRNVAREE